MAIHDPLRIVAGGDVYLEGSREGAPFAALRQYLEKADLFFFNLEAPITARSAPTPDRVYAMKMERGVVPCVVNSGVHVVSLAHNHALDYGVEGLLDTIEILRESNIAYVGAGVNAAAAYGPRLIEIQDTRIGFLALTTNFPFDWYAATDQRPGVAGVRVRTLYTPDWQMGKEHPGWPPTVVTQPVAEDLARVCTEVRQLKQTADVVLVSCHWGVPGSAEVHGYQREIGQALINAGADVVIGHHPHVIQGIERYQHGVICYSLANLVFHTAASLMEEARRTGFDLSTIMGPDSLLLEISVQQKRVVRLRLVPLAFDTNENPRLAVEEAAARIVDRVASLSRRLGSESWELVQNTLTLGIR